MTDQSSLPEGRTLKGVVRYDGTGFSGWQLQREHPTVQGALETAMARIASRQRVPIQGAARTDAGVHAFGQVFSCRWPGEPPDRLRHALSKMTGPAIRVVSLDTVHDGFNARFDARGKRYSYTIDTGREPDPLSSRYAWHIPYRLNLDLIEACLPKLAGTHDFAGFESTGSQMRTTVRTLFRATLHRGGMVGPSGAPNLWHLTFEGDGFLYRMVRNMTGTLIEIARGRFGADFIEESLASQGPFRGHCAPPHGLILEEVFYENQEENALPAPCLGQADA